MDEKAARGEEEAARSQDRREMQACLTDEGEWLYGRDAQEYRRAHPDRWTSARAAKEET